VARDNCLRLSRPSVRTSTFVSLAGYPALYGATAVVAIAAAIGVWQIKSVR
jgi:hypothetical protein